MTDKKATLKIFGSLVSLFLVSGLLIVSSVILFRPQSFAWLADNREVNGGGMQVTVDTLDIEASYYCKGPDDADYVEMNSLESAFAGLLPGDTVWVKILYESRENMDHTALVYLSTFDGCEVPLVIEGRYYYLGTQLKVMETGEFFLEPPADYLSYDDEQSLSDMELGEVQLPAGETAEFEFSVQFVNYADVNQSAYEHFGSAGNECCYRTVTSVFE